MPAATSGILIKEGYAGATIDPEIPALRTSRFQIVVRDASTNERAARALAAQIMTAMTVTLETRVPDGILIKNMRPLTEPIAYPLSVGDNIELSLNFQIIYIVAG